MVIATALGWHNLPSIILAVVLAFFFGYALTLRGLLRAGVDWRKALRLALAADTLSILVMEIVDNGVIVIIPGAMDAGLATGLFWGALAISLLVAFLVTTPINKWIIGMGKGRKIEELLIRRVDRAAPEASPIRRARGSAGGVGLGEQAQAPGQPCLSLHKESREKRKGGRRGTARRRVPSPGTRHKDVADDGSRHAPPSWQESTASRT
jgi:hypothetical protein